MNELMSTNELWVALVLSALCFTGLWRTTTQVGMLLRSGEQFKNRDALARLYHPAWTCRITGFVVAILCGASLAGFMPMPRLVWVAVIGVFLFGLSLAGQGRTLLGDRVPNWMLPTDNMHYEGYAESLERLPAGTIPTATELFSQGQSMEERKDFDGAIKVYGEALAVDSTFVQCMTAKGILHCRKGELQEGRQLFEMAARLAPKSAFVLHLLARVEKQMGRFEEAQTHEQMAQENLVSERARESLPQ